MAKQSRPSAPQSAFAQAAAKSAAAFQAARQNERKVGGSYEPPDIANGEYEAIVDTIECGVVEKGDAQGYPFCRIKVTVQNHDEYEGVQLESYRVAMARGKLTEEAAWDMIFNDFHGLGYEIGENITPADLEGLAADANANPPAVLIRVKNREYVDKNGEKKRGVNVTFLNALEDEGGGEADFEPEEPPPPPAPVKKATRRGK